MSLRAYQQVARRAETPRDAEYRLFADVTRALMDLKSKPRSDIRGWMDALHWNRRLWSVLADCVNISRLVMTRDYYKALMLCRKLIEYEDERLGNVASRLSASRATG